MSYFEKIAKISERWELRPYTPSNSGGRRLWTQTPALLLTLIVSVIRLLKCTILTLEKPFKILQQSIRQ